MIVGSCLGRQAPVAHRANPSGDVPVGDHSNRIGPESRRDVAAKLLSVASAGVGTNRRQEVDVLRHGLDDGRAVLSNASAIRAASLVCPPVASRRCFATRASFSSYVSELCRFVSGSRQSTANDRVPSARTRSRMEAMDTKIAPRVNEGLLPANLNMRSRGSDGWRWRESNPRPMTRNQDFSGCSLLMIFSAPIPPQTGRWTGSVS